MKRTRSQQLDLGQPVGPRLVDRSGRGPWQLDEHTRIVGLKGVADARRSLEAARQAVAERTAGEAHTHHEAA